MGSGEGPLPHLQDPLLSSRAVGVTAQHHCMSSCALVRAPSEETKRWPPALGDTSRLDWRVSYGQIGKCFHFLFLKTPQVSSLGERGKADEFVVCFLLLLSAVGAHNQASRTRCQNPKCFLYNTPLAQLHHCFQRPL